MLTVGQIPDGQTTEQTDGNLHTYVACHTEFERGCIGTQSSFFTNINIYWKKNPFIEKNP